MTFVPLLLCLLHTLGSTVGHAGVFVAESLEGAKPEYDDHCGDDMQLDQANGSMAHVAPRSQGGLGICYAETASQMIDAWRFSHGDTDYSFHTSGISAAVGTALDEGMASKNKTDGFSIDSGGLRNSIEGGQTADVLAWQKKHPTCHDGQVLLNYGGHDYFTDVLKNYFNQYKRYATDIDRLLVSEQALFGESVIGQHLSSPASAKRAKALALARVEEKLKSCLSFLAFPKNLIPDGEVLGKLFESENPLGLLQKFVQSSCLRPGQASSRLPSYEVESGDMLKVKPIDAFRKLNALLDTTKQPIEVGLCANMMTNEGPAMAPVARHSLDGTESVRALVPDCQSHSVLLIGRRKSGGKCQFLIRNSWGASCDSYVGDAAQCTEETSAKGSVWLNADAVSNFAFGYSVLRESRP